ncbi:helix-turn-helix transcriptional regulator [Paenibacillus arenilitoris]|nr:helix-turn-helix transcriptional regulator [Paenibacillus arenilitoris]
MAKVGRNIAKLRKESGITQMGLADRLGISYQAVSNWERGETMPDISKLPLIAEVFDVSIDEILDEGKGTQLLKNMLDHEPKDYLQQHEVSFEEISEIAPLLRTEQVNDFVEHVKAKIEISDLLSVAPFVSGEIVDRLAKQAFEEEGTGMAALAAIAPFMSEDAIDECARKTIEQEGIAALTAVAPFMSEDAVDECAKKTIEKEGMAALAAIAPFMSKDAVDECATKIIDKEGIAALTAVAPFMSEDAIDECAKKAIDKEGIRALASIAPFIRN